MEERRMAEDKLSTDLAPKAPERDFGDSAGYGSGGSTRDYHEVGDEGADAERHRHNPLDEVVKIKNPVQP
jgi:hypothetical protein